MGPLVLALAPALVWLAAQALRRPGQSPRRRALMLLGAFSAVNALVWVLGVIQSRALFQARLFLPGFVALTPLLSETIVRLSALDRPRFSLSTFVRMLVGVALALNLVSQAQELLRINPFGYLAGQEDRTAYLQRILGDHYRAMEAVGQEVPPDGRVLFLWEPRSYYCPRRAQPDAILDSWSFLVYLYGDEMRVAAHLRTEGYSHVLLYQWGLDFVVEYGESPLPPQDVERLEAFIDRYLVLVGTEGHYRLYRLREG
jgi:hypothetical protein